MNTPGREFEHEEHQVIEMATAALETVFPEIDAERLLDDLRALLVGAQWRHDHLTEHQIGECYEEAFRAQGWPEKARSA